MGIGGIGVGVFGIGACRELGWGGGRGGNWGGGGGQGPPLHFVAILKNARGKSLSEVRRHEHVVV